MLWWLLKIRTDVLYNFKGEASQNWQSTVQAVIIVEKENSNFKVHKIVFLWNGNSMSTIMGNNHAWLVLRKVSKCPMARGECVSGGE